VDAVRGISEIDRPLFKPESFLRVVRHPPRILSMSDLPIVPLLMGREKSQN
jgi:hypothetical protein